MTPFVSLSRSRKFWLAVVAVGATVVNTLWPAFPDSIWASIEGLCLLLITTITAEDVSAKLRR